MNISSSNNLVSTIICVIGIFAVIILLMYPYYSNLYKLYKERNIKFKLYFYDFRGILFIIWFIGSILLMIMKRSWLPYIFAQYFIVFVLIFIFNEQINGTTMPEEELNIRLEAAKKRDKFLEDIHNISNNINTETFETTDENFMNDENNNNNNDKND